MTKQELMRAFMRGDLDRRGFVGRLSALGVSAGAAATYATVLSERAAAGAAPSSASGAIARFQAPPEEDYGTAITLESDEAGVTALLDAVSEVLSILSALDGFTADDFDPGVFDILQTIASQQAEHADALASLIGETAPTGEGGGEFASPDEFLTALADAFESLTALYAAVGPALSDGETRQTVTNIASVASRHAALVNYFAGIDPLPETFEQPEAPGL